MKPRKLTEAQKRIALEEYFSERGRAMGRVKSPAKAKAARANARLARAARLGKGVRHA